MQKIVLSLFDLTGSMIKPWADAGFLCYCVDIQHKQGETRDGNIIKVGCNIQDYIPPRSDYAFVSAFPPCTHLATSGACWFRGKGLGMLSDSIRLFWKAAQICEWANAPYIIENPVSTISTYWRRPDYSFDPCDFAGVLEIPEFEAYMKKTCLWVGGGFVMPEKHPFKPLPTIGKKSHNQDEHWQRMKTMHPKQAKLLPKNMSDLRSMTPQGFAKSVFEYNHPKGCNDRKIG